MAKFFQHSRAYIDPDTGNVIATADPLGRLTRTYYDELNRPFWVIQNWSGADLYSNTPPTCNQTTDGSDDTNICTRTYYDSIGNAIATEDPLGRLTRTYFDVLNRPYLTVRNWQGSDLFSSTPPTCNLQPGTDFNICSRTIYDSSGKTIATVNPLGHVTRTYYDALDRPVVMVQNLITATTPISHPTPPIFDEGRPDENVKTEYVYDIVGSQIAAIAYLKETTDTLTVTTRTTTI
jgi:YD repeat-containing protein